MFASSSSLVGPHAHLEALGGSGNGRRELCCRRRRSRSVELGRLCPLAGKIERGETVNVVCGTHKDRQRTVRDLIERLAAIRRDENRDGH